MKKYLYIIGIVLFAVSCRKEDAETADGPSLNDLFGPFEIIKPLTLSHENINFSVDGDLIFNAEFSKNVDWVIDITGSISGAKRTLSGKTKLLSSGNSTWEGGANTFPSFGLEKAYIEVSFPNEDNSPIFIDSVTIIGEKTDGGIVITSFENGIGSNWGSEFSNAPSSITCGDGNAAKGDCYLGWNGTVDWDWGIGSVIVRPDVGTYPLPTNSSNLFFNCAVNFIENIGPDNCGIVFTFYEDDNEDGEFIASDDDAYSYSYTYNKEGWDLISINYSELPDLQENILKGDGIPSPSKIVGINMVYFANEAGGNSKAYVDQLIFTTDEPYRP